MRNSQKIVFFFPSFSSMEATAPLGLLAISTPLLRAGYDVRIIDSTITPNFKQRVLNEAADALCLGVSYRSQPSKLHLRPGNCLKRQMWLRGTFALCIAHS